jgi:dipeptidyl aminopeptidase/acylaminoacyl peptidase
MRFIFLILCLCLAGCPALAASDRTYAELLKQHGYVSFASLDGFKIFARLSGPAQISKPLPAVIMLHGGPHDNFSDIPEHVFKTFIDNGYLVMAVNYRGSRGYDSEYFNKVTGDVGGGDVGDVAAAAKTLQGLSFVQKDRIFLEGHSYGGYLVCLAISRYPDYFRAGVSMSGPVDLREQLRLLAQNVQAGKVSASVLEAMQGDCGQEIAPWRSPVFYVDQVRKPLFIVHSNDDFCCPIEPIKLYASQLQKRDRSLVSTLFVNGYGHDLGVFGKVCTPHAQEVLHKVIEYMNEH